MTIGSPDLTLALGAACAAVRAVLPDDPLPDDLAAISSPPLTLWICGRQGVGKTRLANHLTGTERPTGLGGITQTAEILHAGGLCWVDTPGVEGAAPHTDDLPAPDVVIWVVDSLQPLGQQARRAALALSNLATLRPILGRADLIDAEERPTIEARVRELLPAPIAEPPRWLDARTRPDEALLAALGAPPARPAPHRAGALREALQAARARLGERPVDLRTATPAVRALWRSMVATLSDALPDAGQSPEECAAAALIELHERLRTDPRTAALIRQRGPPPLPAPQFPAVPGSLARSLAGRAGLQRALRADLADWLLTGELALQDWLGAGLPDDAGDRLRHAAHDALDHAEALL